MHGYCLQSKNETKCKCFNGYEGEICEKESNKVKLVKNVQWTTTIICIICILTFCMLVTSNDLFNCLKIGRKNRVGGKNTKATKFYYVP